MLRREDPDAVCAMRLRIGAASEASQQSLMHQQRAHVGMLQSSAETVDIDAIVPLTAVNTRTGLDVPRVPSDSMANNRNNMDSVVDICDGFSEEMSQGGEAGRHGPSEGRSEGGFTNGIIHSFEDAGSISDDSEPVDPELLLGASSFLGFQS